MISKLIRGSLKRRASGQVPSALLRQHFDEEWYRASNPDLADVGDLLGHYLEHGWREGRDPAEHFSARDYLEQYPDIRAAGIEPFSHYLANGRKEARSACPSRKSVLSTRMMFHRKTGLHLHDFPEAFSVQRYVAAAGLADCGQWQALAHFATEGVFEPALIAAAAAGAELLEAIGDACAKEHPAKALHCYVLATRRHADDPRLQRKIGDMFAAIGLPTVAGEFYEMSVNSGELDDDTREKLAQALLGFGEYEQAAAQFDLAFRAHPEKYALRFARDAAAARLFDLRWSTANVLATHENDAEASTLMDRAIAEYCALTRQPPAPPFPRYKRNGIERLAIFGSDMLPQCRLYRIQQKLDQLDLAGVTADFFPLSQAAEFACMVGRYDAVIVYRAPATPEVIDVLDAARNLDVVTIYDIDDLIFDESCYPPSRASLGDMVSPVEYAGLLTGRSLFRAAIAMCDYAIASTPPLQQALARIVRKGVCLLSRNALGKAHMDAIAAIPLRARSAGEPFVLFYGSGSRSHNENFALMAPALARILRRYPQARLQVIGPVELGPAFADVRSQLIISDFTADLPSYWSTLAQADINLAPLTPGIFNDGKSEIKWMEAAMVGVPSIVSPSAVYDETIIDGVDGLIARTVQDWERLIERAIQSPQWSSGIGSAARLRVLKDYGLPAGSANLASLLQQIADQEPLPVASSKPLILTVNIFYPPQYIGGATRIAEQTIGDLRNAYGDAFALEVFCGRSPDGRPGHMARYEWGGVGVTSLSPHGDGDIIERSVETATTFAAYLDRVRPDLIHFHCIQQLTASLIDVARERSIPYVVTAHDGWWISDRQFLIDDKGVPVARSGNWGDARRLARLRECLLGAAATIGVSRSHAELYRERGIANTILIANGSEQLPGVTPPPQDGPVWLGLLGGIGLAKGEQLLREALRKRYFRQLRFLVVDHTMPEGAVRYELWGFNEVKIVGKTSFDNVGSLYSAIHVLLAISVCAESFGLVAREAQRLGRWVVASNRGGMADDLTDGANAFVIDPSRVEFLLEVLERISDDPARFRRPPPPSPGPWRERADVADDLAALYKTVLAGEPVVESR